MKNLSFISAYIDDVNEVHPHLHPDQLVATAIKIMLKDSFVSIPICKNGKCIGRIYTDELKRFINWGDQEDQLIFHKLNFDLFTAITIMQRRNL